MYERFTDRARRVMQLANQEALRFNHEYLGMDHILVGLVKEGSGVAAHVLKDLGIDLRLIRLEMEKRLPVNPGAAVAGRLPHAPSTKAVVEWAIDEAKALGHNWVGTEHLLLGLCRVGGGACGSVLGGSGVTAERVRAEVMRMLGETKAPAAEETVPPPACDPTKERRVRRVSVRRHDVIDWFASAAKDWPRYVSLPDLGGLPPDFEVVTVRENESHQTFDFYVASASFSPLAETLAVPELDPSPVLNSRVVKLSGPDRCESILRELCRAMALLGAKSDLLGVVGSWAAGDASEPDVLSGLRAWNEAAAEEMRRLLTAVGRPGGSEGEAA